MTILDDAPPAQAALADQVSSGARRAPAWSTWRFASRLARREVRRRPGRTALVAVLVAIPVLAMTMAITIARAAADTAEQQFERSSGQADVALSAYEGPSDAIDDSFAALPAGTRAVTMTRSSTRLTTADGRVTEWLDFHVVPFGDPLIDGIYDVTDGRAPRTAGEVLLQRDVATDLGVDVGDTVALARPSGEWTVVGIGRTNDYFDQRIVAVAEFPADRLRDDATWFRILADLPEGTDVDGIAALVGPGTVTIEVAPRLAPGVNSGGMYWSPRVEVEVEPEALAWGWVAGALALAAVGVIIAAAFASSARRQLATIGQLSANGAPERLIRRTLALQGAWTGAIGAGAGIAAGLVAVRFTRPLVEYVVDRPIGGWGVDGIALVVIMLTGVAAATIAATVPARSAARVPVLAALAGRRPLGAVPRWLVPAGVLAFLSGIGLLVLVTIASADSSGDNGNLYAAVALLGGLAVISGMCCASPIAVDAVGRVGARLAGTWRLAARSVARSRTRSAGVMTAIAVTGAAAIAATTIVGSLAFGDEGSTRTMPADAVVVTTVTYASDPVTGEPRPIAAGTDPALVDRVREALPGATVTERTMAAAVGWPQTGQLFLVADDTTVDLMGLSDRDRRTLDDVGLLDASAVHWVVDEQGAATQPYGFELVTPSGTTQVDVAVPADPVASLAGHWGPVITPERAAELGLEPTTTGVVLRAPSDLDPDQRARLAQIRTDLWSNESHSDAFVEPGDAPRTTTDETTWTDTSLQFEDEGTTFPRPLVDAIAVGVAMLLTLLVVAIGLALSATESRDERDVLVAVGGKPRTMRGLAGVKAVVLTVGAAVLAIPTGFLPVAAVLRAAPDDNSIAFPWLTAIGLLVVVPAVAGAAALATSALAQRVRPVRMSTLATD